MGRIYVYTIHDRMVISMSDASDIFKQLMLLMMMDEEMRELNLEYEKLLKKGYAINGSGIAIDMDEIKKAENMYEEEESN